MTKPIKSKSKTKARLKRIESALKSPRSAAFHYELAEGGARIVLWRAAITTDDDESDGFDGMVWVVSGCPDPNCSCTDALLCAWLSADLLAAADELGGMVALVRDADAMLAVPHTVLRVGATGAADWVAGVCDDVLEAWVDDALLDPALREVVLRAAATQKQLELDEAGALLRASV